MIFKNQKYFLIFFFLILRYVHRYWDWDKICDKILEFFIYIYIYIYCFLMFDGFSNSLITFFCQNVTIFCLFFGKFFHLFFQHIRCELLNLKWNNIDSSFSPQGLCESVTCLLFLLCNLKQLLPWQLHL